MSGRSMIATLAIIIMVIAGGLFNAEAEENWNISTDIQATYSNYIGSEERDALGSAGVLVHADYLDLAGFMLGYNRNELEYKTRHDDIQQNEFFISGRYNFYPDVLSGRITARLDLHLLNNDDRTGNTDDVSVVAPRIAYLTYNKRFYLDLGYARSTYQNDLDVDQWTPTAGVAFGGDRHYLQARGYFISPSNSLRAQGENNTTAVELKWHHWLDKENFLGINNVWVTWLIGKRIYAVDSDNVLVYNLADVETGALSAAAQWDFGDQIKVTVAGGLEQYENKIINDDYGNLFIYAGFSKEW